MPTFTAAPAVLETAVLNRTCGPAIPTPTTVVPIQVTTLTVILPALCMAFFSPSLTGTGSGKKVLQCRLLGSG